MFIPPNQTSHLSPLAHAEAKVTQVPPPPPLLFTSKRKQKPSNIISSSKGKL